MKLFEKIKNLFKCSACAVMPFKKDRKLMNSADIVETIKNDTSKKLLKTIDAVETNKKKTQNVRVYDAIEGVCIYESTLDELFKNAEYTLLSFNVKEGQQDLSVKVILENIPDMYMHYKATYDDGHTIIGDNAVCQNEMWFGLPIVSDDNCYLVDLDLYFHVGNNIYKLECGEIIYEYEIEKTFNPINGFEIFYDPDHFEKVNYETKIDNSYYVIKRQDMEEHQTENLWFVMFPEDGQYKWRTCIDNDIINDVEVEDNRLFKVHYNSLINRIAIYRLGGDKVDAIYIRFE